MKYLYILLITLFSSSCAINQKGDIPREFSKAKPGCKSQTANFKGKSIQSTVCMKKILFKPSRYLAKIGDKVIFSGNDYKKVIFDSKYENVSVSGGCSATVKLSTSGNKTIAFSKLPVELVKACKIKELTNGQSSSFMKDESCDKVFYKAVAPLLGTVYPTEASRQCIIKLEDSGVFNQSFPL
jgi:hypothetical protein